MGWFERTQSFENRLESLERRYNRLPDYVNKMLGRLNEMETYVYEAIDKNKKELAEQIDLMLAAYDKLVAIAQNAGADAAKLAEVNSELEALKEKIKGKLDPEVDDTGSTGGQ